MAQDELSRLKNSFTLVKRVLRYTLPQSSAKPSKIAAVTSIYLFTKVEMDYHSHRCWGALWTWVQYEGTICDETNVFISSGWILLKLKEHTSRRYHKPSPEGFWFDKPGEDHAIAYIMREGFVFRYESDKELWGCQKFQLSSTITLLPQ